MRAFKQLILIITLFISSASLASSFHGFIGTIGPLLTTQAGLSSQLSYQGNSTLDYDLEIGSFLYSPSSEQFRSTHIRFINLGISVLTSDIEGFEPSIAIYEDLFIRSSIGYFVEKNKFKPNGAVIGSRRSLGVEITAGFKFNSKNYYYEIIPASVFFPVIRNKTGDFQDEDLIIKLLSFKIGLSFE